MNCIKMLKFTLSALLLTATTAAFAQGESGEVRLKNNTTVSWSEFVKAINDPSSIKGAEPAAEKKALDEATTAHNDAQDKATQADADVTAKEKAYNNANHNLTQWQASLSSVTANYQKKSTELQGYRSQMAELKTASKVTDAWLQAIINDARMFQEYYSNYIKTATGGDQGTIYYRVSTAGIEPILYLSFSPQNEDGWQSTDVKGLYTVMKNKYGDSQELISGIYVYLGTKYTDAADHFLEVSYGGNKASVITNVCDALNILANDAKYKTEYANKEEIDALQTKINKCTKDLSDLETSMNTLQGNIDDLTKAAEGEKTGLQKLKDVWDDAIAIKKAADQTVKDTKTTLDNAQDAYDKAVAAASTAALSDYKDVTLTDDVTATEAIDRFDGVITGNGHVITLEGTQQLFNTIEGNLINVAVNGTIAQAVTSKAAFNNVANWNSTAGEGAFYNKSGVGTDYKTLGALGYAARSNFGVNFVDSKLVRKSNETMVYNITVFEGPRSSTQKYVQFKDGQLYGDNNSVYTIPVNKFAKSEDSGLESIANLFFDGKCENAVIVDKAEFYCPEDIEVASVKYDRQFTAGYNAVCLPFEMTYEMNDGIGALCTYDKETDKRFWFKRIADKVSPNTPILLNAKNDFRFDEIANVKIMATPESQMVSDPGDLEEISECYGIFKPATRDQFNGGASEAHKVYCLTKNNTFASMGSDVNISALRIAIWSNLAQESGEMSVARKIAIVDEKGVEITDLMTSGIESPKAEAAALEITTAPGEIIIASEADLDQVAVYSMDGKLAAVVDVKAGIAATVDVQPGLYVVMGKKVMVK